MYAADKKLNFHKEKLTTALGLAQAKARKYKLKSRWLGCTLTKSLDLLLSEFLSLEQYQAENSCDDEVYSYDGEPLRNRCCECGGGKCATMTNRRSCHCFGGGIRRL